MFLALLGHRKQILKLLIITTGFEIYTKHHGSSEEKIIFNLNLKRREVFSEEGLFELYFEE